MKVSLLALPLGFALACSSAARADVTFTDSEFNLGNYVGSAVYQTGSIGAMVMPCGSCGNPGNALAIYFTFPGPAGAFSQAGYNTGFSYNPATQGAIYSIAASADKSVSLDFALSNFGNTFRPAVYQDGNFYLAAIVGAPITITDPNGGTTGFLNFSNPYLRSSDFLLYDFTTGAFGTTHPDFSGDTLYFGLAQLTNTVDNTGPGHDAIVYDNLNILVNNATPEPASLFLLGTGILSTLGVVRYRKSAL